MAWFFCTYKSNNCLIFLVNMSICSHTSMEFYSCSPLFNYCYYTLYGQYYQYLIFWSIKLPMDYVAKYQLRIMIIQPFFLNPVLYGLLPVVVLASFGYGTYTNIHQLTSSQRRNRGKIEEQLAKSIILQCASFILSQVSFYFIEKKNFLYLLIGTLHIMESLFNTY